MFPVGTRVGLKRQVLVAAADDYARILRETTSPTPALRHRAAGTTVQGSGPRSGARHDVASLPGEITGVDRSAGSPV